MALKGKQGPRKTEQRAMIYKEVGKLYMKWDPERPYRRLYSEPDICKIIEKNHPGFKLPQSTLHELIDRNNWKVEFDAKINKTYETIGIDRKLQSMLLDDLRIYDKITTKTEKYVDKLDEKVSLDVYKAIGLDRNKIVDRLVAQTKDNDSSKISLNNVKSIVFNVESEEPKDKKDDE